MSQAFRPPCITGETPEEQLQQVIGYLRQLAGQLQHLPRNQSTPAVQKEEPSRSIQFQNLRVHGSVNGVYIQSAPSTGSHLLLVQTCFNRWDDEGLVRQSILISGSTENQPVLGVAVVDSTGSYTWRGTENVTVWTREGGILEVSFSHYENDLVLQSSRPFSVL